MDGRENNVTTGVSAQDRVTTIKSAISKDGISKIVSPGHRQKVSK
ncbi:MAG: 3,4-dihydroxy-2-butanone-4-phosphate synthase [Halarcobacter sp.]